MATTAFLMLMQAVGVPLASRTADVAALAAILVTGLPHGALDLLEHRADPRIAEGRWKVLGVYLALGALMGTAWYVSPAAALAIFLGVAVIHFAADADPETPLPMRLCRAGLLVALPCATHPALVAAVFAGLAADVHAGSNLTTLAGDLAWPLLAALGIAAALWPIRLRAATEMATIMVALALLPPLPAFAVFFGLIHSPRHFAATAATLGFDLGKAALLAVPATLIAIAFGLVLSVVLFARVDRTPLASTTAFMLLSIVTVPHMFTGPLLRWLSAGRERAIVRWG